MSLRQTAAADLLAIQSDGVTGFGWPVVLISPDGVETPLTGFSNDIGLSVDPDTGQAVSGRIATVSLPIAALNNAGITTLPEGIPDAHVRPWLVRFDDIHGNPFTFKVTDSAPDRAIGNLLLTLEAWRSA